MEVPFRSKPSQSDFERALGKHFDERPSSASDIPTTVDIRQGLTVTTLDRVSTELELSPETLERMLGVSSRTLQRRRRTDQRLSARESDRLWRLLYVLERAIQTFDGNTDAARQWLLTPKPILNAETPLQRLDTEPGFREVEDMLTVLDETAAA